MGSSSRRSWLAGSTPGRFWIAISPWCKIATPEYARASEGGSWPGTRRGAFLCLGLLILAGLCLRLYGLGAQSIWIDEAYSLRLAALAPRELVVETALDNHPPLYYLTLSAWLKLGPDGETWARLLSALLGALGILIVFFFYREVAPEPIPTMTSGWIAISPLAIWHSQDARMYSLMLATSYLTLLLFLRYLRKGGAANLLGFVLALVGALYTHLYLIFLVPVLLAYLWLSRRDSGLRSGRALAGIVVALICCLPWVWVVMTVALHKAGFYKPISVFSIPYALFAFSVGYSLGPSVAAMHGMVGSMKFPLDQVPVVLLAAVAFGAPFVMGAVALLRRRSPRDVLVLLLFAVPLLLPVFVTLMSRIDFNPRYAVAAFPAYLLIVSTGLSTLSPRVLGRTVALGMLVLTLASLHNYYRDSSYAKEDTRAAYQWIDSHRSRDDCLLVLGVIPAFRYYEGRPFRSEWLDFRKPEMLRTAEETLARWSEQCDGLWFVMGRRWEEDPLDLALPTVEKYFEAVTTKELAGIQVIGLKPRRQPQERVGASAVPRRAPPGDSGSTVVAAGVQRS